MSKDDLALLLGAFSALAVLVGPIAALVVVAYAAGRITG
jgi:hypothetical protein